MEHRNRSRRRFLAEAGVAGAALLASPALMARPGSEKTSAVTAGADPFKLKYAPSIGMFRNMSGTDDPVENIKFIHDQGFRAVFDNGFPGRSVEEQNKIAAELTRLGMDFGPYVLYADFSTTSFVLSNQKVRDLIAEKMKAAVEISKRTGFKRALIVPGRYDESLHPDFQRSNVIDNLRYCAGFAEPEGITLVIEPLNRRDHPGLFLTGMPQAYQICDAVDSPSVKIIDDLYHQQISEGNLIPNIEACWDRIGAFHIGDNPGRNEPLTGEVNFKNIFKFIFDKGYQGVLCMEHGRSIAGKDGEMNVIKAYRECDVF